MGREKPHGPDGWLLADLDFGAVRMCRQFFQDLHPGIPAILFLLIGHELTGGRARFHAGPHFLRQRHGFLSLALSHQLPDMRRYRCFILGDINSLPPHDLGGVSNTRRSRCNKPVVIRLHTLRCLAQRIKSRVQPTVLVIQGK